ncbi:hypothetical protein Tco_0012981 [Tanacetum coccineum]
MPNHSLDKEDSSFKEILDDLFRIGGENLRSMEYEEVPNRYDKEIVGETDHESGKEEVPMKDVEINEYHDVDQPDDKSNLVQQITPSSISDEVDARRVVLGWLLAARNPFKLDWLDAIHKMMLSCL